jgi:hypothetical protein
MGLLCCRQREKALSFYYWRTQFNPDSTERAALTNNRVSTLYTRYFDVDFLPQDTAPASVAPLVWGEAAISARIIPVVFIKNRVFERLDSLRTIRLAQNIFKLVNGISQAKKLQPTEIQFDCDWTDGTRLLYFHFLEVYRQVSHQTISATIRLHQIKYAHRTGIPPVDAGVLMYYNMGSIEAGNSNSIYDKSIAEKYIPSLKSYPLTLDIAMPIFAWGLQLRNGRVVKLLNKMNFLHFENDANFTALGQGRFAAKNAGFHGGYYFQANDEIKTEHVTEEQLLDIAAQVNRYSNHRIRNLILYDLDKENLALYDPDSFQKIMDHLD